jgi:hypothetical protein
MGAGQKRKRLTPRLTCRKRQRDKEKIMVDEKQSESGEVKSVVRRRGGL